MLYLIEPAICWRVHSNSGSERAEEYKSKSSDRVYPHGESLDELRIRFEKYIAQFATNGEILDALLGPAGEGFYYCRDCGDKLERITGARKIKCRGCGKVNWVTAGTFFHSMKKPEAWLGACWLFEQEIELSGPKLAYVLSISTTTASHIKKAIGLVAAKYMHEKVEQVSTGEFRSVYCKRSSQTPIELHPVTEQDELERTDCANSPVPQDLNDDERMLLSLINDVPISSDELREKVGESISGSLTAILFSFELSGLVTSPYTDRYVRRTSLSPLTTANSPDGRFEKFCKRLKKLHHGIARKTVQIYAALYWYYSVRKELEQGWLARALVNSPIVQPKHVRGYISPAVIKIFGTAA